MSLQAGFKKPAPQPQAAIIPFVGPRLMSPEKAADYIGRSLDVMYEMIHGGEIPFVRNGRLYTIDRVDLDKWIDAHKESERAA
jgi:excisionase family DNA binding protein